jgi:putative addiction module killer protein
LTIREPKITLQGCSKCSNPRRSRHGLAVSEIGRRKSRINARIRRLSLGNAGDVKPVGSGVSELRVDYGPGYRVYFMQRGHVLAVLLCGGDKRTQDADIKRAIKISKDWKG